MAELGIPVDHGSLKQGHHFISDFSEQEMQIMTLNNISFEVLISDVKSFYQERSLVETTRNSTCTSANGGFVPEVPSHFNTGSMAGYYTYDEYISELDEMAQAYPNLITVKTAIDTFQTHEGRPIYWVKISDFANTDESEPEVLYTAIHHAREPLSLSATIFYMWYLLENYTTNPEIAYLVNETEMYFVPMINPDGYIENQTTDPNGGGMWRKNKRNLGGGIFGVDLNRNYSYEWGTTGIDFNQTSDVYPGDSAFSEPETQAIKWFCEHRDFLFAFNAHTYSNLMLFPIGSSTTEFAADHDYLMSLGQHMVQYSGFVAQKSSDLYPASGDSDDYMYLMDLSEKPKIFAYTPEIGSDADGFWPAESSIIPLCQGMVFSNLVLSEAAHNYWLVRETDPSTILTTTGNFNFEVQRLGISDSSITVSIEPLLGINSVGAPQTFSGAMNASFTGAISYVLASGLQQGNQITYVLTTDFGDRIKRDTITKTFGNPTLQFEDLGTNTSNWTGNWALTTAAYYSPSSSFTDSPGADYQNNSAKNYQFVNTIDLTHATTAKVEFYAKWALEDNFDYVQFQISIDGGSTWIPQCGKYTNAGVSGNGGVQPNDKPLYDGFETDWVLEEISLNDYLGESIKMRFVFESDGGVREDGFYFDDFKVLYDVDNVGLNNVGAEIFSIFPNPANNEVKVVKQNGFDRAEVKLVNLDGKTIYSEKVSSTLNTVSIPLENLQNGMYFVELVEHNNISRSKLQVLH